MTCAKRTVVCIIVARDGRYATGSNICGNPQVSCPREAGEGYQKCKTVCRQGAHAEINALTEAKRIGLLLWGATAYIIGHNHACQDCLRALHDECITDIRLKE